MIFVYLKFCGLLAVALLTSLFLSGACQAGTKIFIENFSPLRLTGGGDQFSSVGSQQRDLDEESVGNCCLDEESVGDCSLDNVIELN